ncbi:MAG: alpha/beta hydrolase [Actinomycetia bacterium]|nr:alpha/beta hydrolase [Actinomycetes bacterium]
MTLAPTRRGRGVGGQGHQGRRRQRRDPVRPPAGLNDCGSGLRWMADNKEDLGVSHIVVSGESGGGNLTLATVLEAKADGNLGLVAGAYAQCPYISGMYATKEVALPSLYENDGYFLDVAMMGALARV